MRAAWTIGAAIATFFAVSAPDFTENLAIVLHTGAPPPVMQPADVREPELPRATVDISDASDARLKPSRYTRKIIVSAATGNLQTALDDAKPGDVIVLDAGGTYEGPFRLPRKDGDGWILVTSSASLPNVNGPRQHVIPSMANRMPKLIAPSGAVIAADPGAHHYRLAGLEIAPASGVFLKTLVELGGDETAAADLPHHIIIDRCYVHGDPKAGSRRGVALNGRDEAVVHSYLSDFKEVGADSQAIAGWNGSGPFKIADNYLEAAGENVMFGGADPTIPDLVPADIEVVRNQMTKAMAWKSGAQGYEGVAWAVKNLFELKNARRVLVDGNTLEYNWPHAQNGFAILFTPRNQDGRSPWSVVEDVTFQNNLVRHVGCGINILGHDDIHSSQPTQRIAIRNNLFVDVGGRWGGGRLFQLLDGTSDVQIDHNTAFQTDTMIWGGDGRPHVRFVFENNITPSNQYGIIGGSTGPGRASLERYFPGAVIRRNAIVGAHADAYPADNFFPNSIEQVGFAGASRGNYRLAASSSFRRAATDGADLGVNVEAIPAS